MRPSPVSYMIPVEHAIFGVLAGLAIYAWEGSVGAAIAIGIMAALLGWTIDEDQKAYRDPDEEPSQGARESFRERVRPPALAESILQLQGWRRLGAIVLHLLAPPLCLLPFALEAVASGEDLRVWIGVAFVVLVGVPLLALGVALVLLALKGGAPKASPFEPPSV